MRAMMSLPVPLSPWISTGTLAAATLSMRARNASMASECPKTIGSGGISPIDCTRELTEFVVVITLKAGLARLAVICAPGTPNVRRRIARERNKAYTICSTGFMGYGDKDSAATALHDGAMKGRPNCRKIFSHCRTKLPSSRSGFWDAIEQGAGELQAE